MPVVVLVPGLGVRRYLSAAADALGSRGFDARLLPAPGSTSAPADLREYGGWLASRSRCDVLLGLSVGAQAAALAARGQDVGRLVLSGPTVDPRVRSAPRLLGAWLRGLPREPARLGLEQLPDWVDAGARRLATTFRSALAVPTERVLDGVRAPVTIVRGTHDVVTSHAWAAALAAGGAGRELVLVPGATHSWPYGDEERFADLVAGLSR